MNDLLKIANTYGNVDVRLAVPKGYAHVRGKRLQPLCRKFGIQYAQALVDWGENKSHPKPVLDGVVVCQEHAEKLRAEIDAREKRSATRQQQVARKKEKGQAKLHDQRFTEFCERFPAASEETVATYCKTGRAVYGRLEEAPLDALTQQESDDLGLIVGREVAALLLDGGATVVRLYDARLPEDVSPPPEAEAVHREATERGITPQKALWAMNKLVKMVRLAPKREMYLLKDRLLSLWSAFLIEGRIARTETRICWGCDGTGKRWYGEECERCDGTGVFSSSTLYEVRYQFPDDDRIYCFHTYSRPHLLSEEPGADKRSYGHRFTAEERRELHLGVHDLLRYLRHEAKVQEAAAKRRALQEQWDKLGLPPFSAAAPTDRIDECLTLLKELLVL